MITNKDIRIENGNIILNGDKYPLDGQSPEAIMDIVETNSDTTPTENSTAPVTSGGVYTALGAKQDSLTFDNAPTASSDNPVKSGGVFTAITGEIIAEDKNISVTGNGTDSYVAADYDLSKSGYKCIGISSCSLSNINYVLLSSVITPGSTDSSTRMLFGTRNAAAWPSDFTATFNLTLLYKKVNS
jgi:hypothetical protein